MFINDQYEKIFLENFLKISTEAEIFWYFLSPLSLWERGRG